MMRKYLLVGQFIILEAGSILQITIGTIVSAAYLMIQVRIESATTFSKRECTLTRALLESRNTAQRQAVQERKRRLPRHLVEFRAAHGLPVLRHLQI